MSELIGSKGTWNAGYAALPRASAAEGCPAHPCLIGNNSNNTAPHTGWKTAFLVKLAILQMIENWGVDNVGMYTFTFSEDMGYKEASRRWNSFNTRVLSSRYDGDWIKVLELTKRRRPHYHFIVHVPGIRLHAKILHAP